MTWQTLVESLTTLSPVSVVFRLVLSAVLSGFIGLDREKRNHAAGFRTHMLVSVAATLVMLTNLYIFENISHGAGDASRMAAQVISGIGFLGAGTIMISGRVQQIRGLTTAASLWAVACVGLAIGCGFYLASLTATALILIVVSLLVVIDKRYRPRSAAVHLFVEFADVSVIKDIIMACKSLQFRIVALDLQKGQRGKGRTQAGIFLLEGDMGNIDALVPVLEVVDGVLFVTSLDHSR